ncbi:tetratricopeptide repeat protein [Desulfoluna sp.]|uniref:tetratricopeptide repeat protein n=1 Tax=Desulfoluna sp. TaxID=2045199 RepID=UPI0026281318|nr:tetratricopeptide repeat protein [Desulfoluna sp.]
MTEKNDSPGQIVQTRTSPLLLILVLAIGFISGVAFSAWKLKSPAYKTSNPQETNKISQMAQALEAQIAKAPQNADLLVRLGNTYFDMDQYPGAIDAYQRALALIPGNSNILTDLGIMYRRNGQPLQAVDAFNEAISADKAHENAYLNKGIVLMYDLKKREEAMATWEALREINPLAMAGNQSIDELIAHFRDDHDKEGKK